MTETRRLTTIEGQLEAALAAVRAVQARGLRVLAVTAGYGERARVLIQDPHHRLDDLGVHGVAHSAAQTAERRPIMERYTVIGDAYIFWLLAEDEARLS